MIKDYQQYMSSLNESLDNTSNNKERKKELIQYLKNRKYDDYINVLDLMLSDPKLKVLIEDGFGGELGDMKFKFKATNIAVDKLIPTQNEIDLDKSLKFGLEKPDSLDNVFKDVVEIKHPLVTFNGNFIIDGHHRWSQVMCFNPKAKMTCIDYSADISPIQMLKLTQGAIAADLGSIPSQKVDGVSVYNCTDKQLEGYIYKHVAIDGVDKIKKYVSSIETIDDYVEYVKDCTLNIKYNHPFIVNAPSRSIMPQTGKSGKGDPNKDGSALNRLKNGEFVNIPGNK